MTPMASKPEIRGTNDVEDNPAKAAVMAWAELVGHRGSAHADTLMQSYQSAAKQLRDDLKAQSDEIKKGLETFSTETLKTLDERGRKWLVVADRRTPKRSCRVIRPPPNSSGTISRHSLTK